MENEKRNTQEEQIRVYAAKMRKAYTNQYRKEHTDRVKQWRANATLNAYKRLVRENPAYFIDRNEVMQ